MAIVTALRGASGFAELTRLNSEALAPSPTGWFDANMAEGHDIVSAAQGREDWLVSERGRFHEFKGRYAGQGARSAGQLTGGKWVEVRIPRYFQPRCGGSDGIEIPKALV